MNIIEIKQNFISKNFICLFFGHKVLTTRTITNHIKEYKCAHCDLELTNDVKGRLTFLSPERKEINETLKHFLQKKTHAA
jgi:transcription elongation factor Elf1